MARHPFDPVSLVFGALAIAAGLVVLTGGSLTDEARFLLPGGLIALGIALLAKVGGARRELDPATSAGPAGSRPLDDRDLDDLLAPMDDDDLLARWDAEQAAARARGTNEALVAPVATQSAEASATSDDRLALTSPDDSVADDTQLDDPGADTVADDTVADGPVDDDTLADATLADDPVADDTVVDGARPDTDEAADADPPDTDGDDPDGLPPQSGA